MNIKNLFKNILGKISNINSELTTVNTALDGKLTISDLKYDTVTLSVSLAAQGTNWATAVIPSDRLVLALQGYYITGTGNTNCSLYCCRFADDNTLLAAIRNWSGNAFTTQISLSYTYIDV